MDAPSAPRPRVVVLAGINGAGKTSAARHLCEALRVPSFTNADTIARGLNALDVESVATEAGRLLLEHLRVLTARRRDFAFETTLSGRAYARWRGELVRDGYAVHLFYYWLNSPELAIRRVADRVRAGGHHVPDDTVRRRYPRTAWNFLELYRPVVTTWQVYDNSGSGRRLIAFGDGSSDAVIDPITWAAFTGSASHDGANAPSGD